MRFQIYLKCGSLLMMFISIINYDCEILFDEKVSNRPVIHKATDFFSLRPANQINNSNKIKLSVEAENGESSTQDHLWSRKRLDRAEV